MIAGTAKAGNRPGWSLKRPIALDCGWMVLTWTMSSHHLARRELECELDPAAEPGPRVHKAPCAFLPAPEIVQYGSLSRALKWSTGAYQAMQGFPVIDTITCSSSKRCALTVAEGVNVSELLGQGADETRPEYSRVW